MPTARATLSAAPPVRPGAAEQAIAGAIQDLNAGQPAAAVARLAPLRPDAVLAAPTRCLVGRVLTTAGEPAAARPWFDAALAADPAFAEALVHRADALARLWRWDEAAVDYEAAQAADTLDATAFYRYGTVLARLDRPADALGAYDQALLRQPALPEAWRGAGIALKALGDTDNALTFLDQALALRPDFRDAILDRANLLHGLDRFAEALATYDAGLAHRPADPLLWSNRAIVLHDLGRMVEGLASADAAIGLDQGFAPAHLNRGTVLFRLGRFDEALAASDRALARVPDYAAALCCRGLALKMLGRFDAAGAAFAAALAADPDSIHARANQGELNLLLGRFAEGWPDYEYRFFTERQSKPKLSRPIPEWRGEAAPGARVVVLVDQGNGDTLQFARFLPELVARGAAVTLLCPARLQRVLRSLTAGVEVVAAIDDESRFDYQVALSSLPGAFRTDVTSLAGTQPYLAAEPDRVRRWAARIGTHGLRIGLCWRGSQNWQCDPRRSLALRDLQPLAVLPGVRVFSLQLPDNSERPPEGLAIDDLGAELDRDGHAFVDTAAALMSLDHVVTCDTSIAHLAGALGRPTSVLLQAVPEWRWMLERTDSPWYPSLRLFRQEQSGDWAAPVAAVVAALRG